VYVAKTKIASVDDYLSAQPADVQPILAQVRATLQKALPEADEVISYQIPAYRLPEGVVVFFAGWKQHYSLYPASQGVQKEFAEALEEYAVHKGTIRFPLDAPVPETLIAGIAKLRAQEIRAEARAKPKRKR
jgi:uncharacterized protein YdhG (YjbR/CyaY superfamily)